MPDLASLVLYLRPTHQDTIPAWTGRAAHAWFLDSLRRVQPELSAAVHDGQGIRPFTVSSLLGVGSRSLTTLRPERVYTLRVTTLHPDLTALTLHGLLAQWLADGVTLHDQPLRVERISVDERDDPWAGTDSYAALLERHTLNGRGRQPPHRITFTFATPTAFKKTGGLQVPLPIPELVFGSLIERWMAFSPVPLHPDLKTFVAQCCTVSSHRIKTRRLSFERSERGAVTGFIGEVTFAFQSSDRYWLSQVNMLSAFAMYSGVGARTTMGLGQVRKLTQSAREREREAT